MSCVTSSIVVPRACQSRSTSSCIRIRVKASSDPSGSSSSRTLGWLIRAPGQGRPLGHAAGQLVRVDVGEAVQADQAP